MQDMKEADALYVERADAIISGETAKWISSQEQQTKTRSSNT